MSGPPAVAPKPRGPLPQQPEYDQFPPPPPSRPGMNGGGLNNSASNGGGSADVSGASLNDSNSTTQSNIASECSEAECDREPLVKQDRTHVHGAAAADRSE